MSLPAFAFATAGRILFGRGKAAEAAGAALAYGPRVLLVHGASGARAQWLAEALRAGGAQLACTACKGEPDLPLLTAALEAGRAQGPDVVIALGGGAAIDLGKALAALIPAGTDPLDHLEVVGKGLPLPCDPLPFIALPTTSGTGAEVTKNAVIGVPAHSRKVSLRDDRMLARLAIVDPALTDDAPRGVTLASGLDAVTQVIEPYVSARANPLSDALCADAIPRGLRALVRLMEAEDPAARDEMAWVSLCGGLALANAGLGAVHGLAGVIGGLAPAPHGAVCGLLLPHVMQANHAALPEGHPGRARLDWIAGEIRAALGTSLSQMPAWMARHGLPDLAQMGLARGALPGIAEASAASSSMKANPVTLSARQLQDVLEAAWQPGA